MEVFHHLGYPDCFATLLGTTKALGGIALVAPVPHTLREWAYAGLVFDATAAVFSILAVGDPVPHLIIPTIYLALTIGSFRAWREAPRAPATRSRIDGPSAIRPGAWRVERSWV